MGKALAEAFPVARAVFDEADAALGFSLSRLCFEGPEAELTLTANAQPAILTTSIAALRVLESETDLRAERGRRPLAGRVLGAGRGRIAARSPTRSASSTCAASSCRRRSRRAWARWRRSWGSRAPTSRRRAPKPHQACDGEIVSAANFNGAGQVVIAGHKAAVDRACAAAKSRGAKRAMPLGGERAVPLRAHAAGRRSAGGRAGRRAVRAARGAGGHQRRGDDEPGRVARAASC